MDEHELELIYTQQLSEELNKQTKAKITDFIQKHPINFGLTELVSSSSPNTSNSSNNDPSQDQLDPAMPNDLANLYQEVFASYNDNGIQFNHVLNWSFAWRQQLTYRTLTELYGVEKIVASTHPRAKKAVNQICLERLDQYMQWFPWSWFSNLRFIGAGGFSAVYAAQMNPPYDIEPMMVALKVVDEKILNEIAVQGKAFLPLLFQGVTVCESTGDLMMVMKMSNDGNLEDHMQQLPLGDLDLKTITGTILRLAVNLADLHKAGLCHRNVHPSNIICTDNDYFLVDYRFSTPSKESSSVTALTRAVYGRLPYIAPEVKKGIYTEKADIYSLGIIIWQLVSKVIFPSPDVLLDAGNSNSARSIASKNSNSNDDGFLENVYRIEPVPGLPDWYHDLYISCLEPKPENRPTAAQLCEILRLIHDSLNYSVPLNEKVTEYIVARRAEVADHIRTYAKIKGIVSASTTRLFTLSNLPSTESFVRLPFTHKEFDITHWYQLQLVQQQQQTASMQSNDPTLYQQISPSSVSPTDIFLNLESVHLLV
ncbi:kinase-like domain-containing protein [Mycotypha africana]|uniref:kinase-like domain-containing protein n=1 Tax=Mycotypha africana TaxID=64632 RepID=UPI0023003909|nr:kinase-like domain-containing protein [Mycotypha africana]KAI8973315.1 kinase-like domain-containing protein [Mycotypha africana]